MNMNMSGAIKHEEWEEEKQVMNQENVVGKCPRARKAGVATETDELSDLI